MNNKFTTLYLGLLSLVHFSAQSQEAVQISITIESAHDGSVDEAVKKELFEQAVKSMQDICNATSCQVTLNLTQSASESSVSLEQALQVNLQSFVDACNKHAAEEGQDVLFSITTHDDEISIVISCKEAEPKRGYWQSIKSTVHSAAETVSDKAKNAGGYIKTGAQKVSSVAKKVKEKAKQGIHTAAEKVSEFTQ